MLLEDNQLSQELNYVLHSPRGPIVLDLFEAERYESAVVVQPLIGNLVYYSNRGRYEPKLAKHWVRETPSRWRFKLHEDLFCENGEPITAESFKASILRSLRMLSKNADFPVFSKLIGFQAFKAGGNLDGLIADGQELIFTFEQPIRSGLLQLLSFAPFGYICSENLNPDGSWKNKERFISSGPYRVESLEIGIYYLLARNPKWNRGYQEGAPEKIRFTHNLPEKADERSHWIIDSYSRLENLPQGFSEFNLVPEYINSILMGNLKSGYFSSPGVRRAFKALLEKHRNQLPEHWGGQTRSSSFYPKQKPDDPTRLGSIPQVPIHEGVLRVGGPEPKEDDSKGKTWTILKAALQEAGLRYVIDNGKCAASAMTDVSLDLRMSGGSIGGGVEPWGISVVFCTDFPPRFPDPSGGICKLVENYENDRINDNEFAEKFQEIVEADAAITPVSHYGIHLYLTPGVVQETLSPFMRVMRFEDLRLD